MSLLETTLSAIRTTDDAELARSIRDRLDRLTKPRGSLGRLEEIAVQYGLARGTADLRLASKLMLVCCADHGVAAEGVSAYPSEVTAQMVRNFVAGGAAINVLCRQHRIDTRIVDVGVNAEFEPVLPICARKIARGTRSFLRGPAMTREEARRAVEVGIALARDAAAGGYDVLGTGEMGIGNTTAATAIVACFSGRDPGRLTGRGTGIDEARVAHKADVVRRALATNRPDPSDPLAVLTAVGGFEIGAIAGIALGAAAARRAVAVDGFIASSGALVAARLDARVLGYLFFSHRSAEPGHTVLLDELPAKPLLDLDMRLGEGTGAALAIGIMESAVRLYNEMATFESAAVSGESPHGR